MEKQKREKIQGDLFSFHLLALAFFFKHVTQLTWIKQQMNAISIFGETKSQTCREVK